MPHFLFSGFCGHATQHNLGHAAAPLILRTGWYRPVHVKSIESHYVRTLLAARKALLRKCIDLENEVLVAWRDRKGANAL